MKYSDQKKYMAYLGYYSIADFAKMKGFSRQHAHRNKERFLVNYYFDKPWLKYDDGQKAEEIYGKYPLAVFERFGFSNRGRNRVVDKHGHCEIKLLSITGKIGIFFYDDLGNAILLHAKIDESEIINQE